MWGNQDFSGGAGFLKSPDGMSQSGSQGPEKKKAIRAQNLVPMTISQIIKSDWKDDKLHVGEIEVNMISIVGLVVAVEQQTTHIMYEIDDSTGRIKVQQWLEDDEGDEDSRKPMVENTYVRVVGTVKSMQGKRNVTVFKICPVTDLNELTCHLLEVMHSRKMASSTVQDSATQGFGTRSTYDNNMSVPMDVSDYGANAPMGLTKTQGMVYQMIRSDKTESGVTVEWVKQQVRGMNPAEVTNAVTFLSDEGHIYSTIDEHHYRTTDSMMS